MTTFNIKYFVHFVSNLKNSQRSSKGCEKNYKIKDGNNFSLNTTYSPGCACTLSRQLNISVKKAKTYKVYTR